MKRTLTKDQLTDICDLLNLDGDNVRTDYTGRGMYGRSCVGFDVEPSEIVAVGAALVAVLARETEYDDDADLDTVLDDAIQMARGACVDSMGTGAIVYFPSVTVAP